MDSSAPLLDALRRPQRWALRLVLIKAAAVAGNPITDADRDELASLVALHGARLLTDDVLTVDPGPPLTCLGGATELRLREAAASLADTAPAGATRRTADDRVALTLERAPAVPYPLAAIIVPNPSRTEAELQLTVIEPSLALMAMLAIPRVYGWAKPDVLARDFATLSAVANAVPIYKAVVPWGPPFDPMIAEVLTRLITDRAPG